MLAQQKIVAGAKYSSLWVATMVRAGRGKHSKKHKKEERHRRARRVTRAHLQSTLLHVNAEPIVTRGCGQVQKKKRYAETKVLANKNLLKQEKPKIQVEVDPLMQMVWQRLGRQSLPDGIPITPEEIEWYE